MTVRERVGNPTSSKANPPDNTRLIRVKWVELREFPGTRDVLEKKVWDALEEMEAKMPKKSVVHSGFGSDLNRSGKVAHSSGRTGTKFCGIVPSTRARICSLFLAN